MAFVFEFDPIHRIIGIRFSEDVTSDDLMYFYRMAALLVESFDPLSAIIDFSEVTTVNTDPQFMRELASLPPLCLTGNVLASSLRRRIRFLGSRDSSKSTEKPLGLASMLCGPRAKHGP